MTKIVIIGGGISGLATAHRLSELGKERRLSLQITLVEAKERLGGVIETQKRDGFLLESGPDAFISDKPWALELCQRIGMGDQILETNRDSRQSFIVRDEKLIAVPKGLYLVAPARISALFRSSLLSWPGKFRMALEPFIPARSDQSDESVGSFIRRRLGREALERLGQPMIGGIYTADPERLSLRATMPMLYDMEKREGSLLRALRARAKASPGTMGNASGPRYSIFLTLRDGLTALIDGLRERIPDVSFRLSSRVEYIEQGPAWKINLADGQMLEADLVCLALPTGRAAALLRTSALDVADELTGIPYESVATVNVAYRRSDVPHALGGFGFVIPAVEGRRIVGCTFSSIKFSGRTPEGCVLLRAFLGGVFHREVFELDDVAMERMVLEEMQSILGVNARPIFVSIRRYRHSMPQYHVGHLERVRAIEQKCSLYRGLYLSGNGYRGIGIPDCVHQAEETAARMAAYAEKIN